jgi:high-affinity nickel permease
MAIIGNKRGVMFHRSTLLCFAAFVLPAIPASAATYVGTLNGIIIGGTSEAAVAGPATGLFYNTDLTGQPISIAFTIDTIDNYTNVFGSVISHLVNITQLGNYTINSSVPWNISRSSVK